MTEWESQWVTRVANVDSLTSSFPMKEIFSPFNSCLNFNLKILTKPCAQSLNKSFALWPNLSSQICNKLLPTQSSSSTLATATTLTSFELASSHTRVILIKFTKQEWVSEWVREGVTDKHNQWLDSGPIKISVDLRWLFDPCYIYP